MADWTSQQIDNQQAFSAVEFVGHQFVTSLTSSTGLTVPVDASKAIVQVEGTVDVRYRLDGSTTAPTASVGVLLPAGSSTALVGGGKGTAGRTALLAVRFIEAAVGGKLNVSYFK